MRSDQQVCDVVNGGVAFKFCTACACLRLLPLAKGARHPAPQCTSAHECDALARRRDKAVPYINMFMGYVTSSHDSSATTTLSIELQHRPLRLHHLLVGRVARLRLVRRRVPRHEVDLRESHLAVMTGRGVGGGPHGEGDTTGERHRLQARLVSPETRRLQDVAGLVELRRGLATAAVDRLLPTDQLARRVLCQP